MIKEPSISSDSDDEVQQNGKLGHVPHLKIKYSEPPEKIAAKDAKLNAMNVGIPRGNKTFSSDDSGANTSVRYAVIQQEVEKPLERINIDH